MDEARSTSQREEALCQDLHALLAAWHTVPVEIPGPTRRSQHGAHRQLDTIAVPVAATTTTTVTLHWTTLSDHAIVMATEQARAALGK
eukprot:5067089-Prorocentrum_lima.AAC.1